MKRSLLVAAALIALAACADQSVVGPDDPGLGPSFALDDDDDVIRVLSRNLYIGASVASVIGAPPQDVPFVVASAFATLAASDFPGRLGAMADEIAATRPHLVGLQEITIIRRQSPGDFLIGNPTPASTVVADFEAVLLAALAARGLDYRVVARIENTDVELPMFAGFSQSGPLFDDLRTTDFDLILARGDVAVTNVTERNFQAVLPIGFDVVRGWVAVDAEIGDETFRFVNTHLEAFSEQVRFLQASELIQSLAGETTPLIVLGDFNSEATHAAGATYRLMLASGYVDVWSLARPGEAGFTCCQATDLRNPVSTLAERIDHVFVRAGPGRSFDEVEADLLGEEPGDRINGLWPSDHAGVFAAFELDDDDDDDNDDDDDDDDDGDDDGDRSD